MIATGDFHQRFGEIDINGDGAAITIYAITIYAMSIIDMNGDDA